MNAARQQRSALSFRASGASQRLAVAFLCSIATIAGCASSTPPINAFTNAEVVNQKVDASVRAGMPREELAKSLDGLGFKRGWQIWRTQPPGVLARAWPPGGFWTQGGLDVVRYTDFVGNLDDQGKLISWTTQRGELVYRFGEPASPGQDPRRKFPLPPLPPEEWRGPNMNKEVGAAAWGSKTADAEHGGEK
jgi:hypothetical protein